MRAIVKRLHRLEDLHFGPAAESWQRHFRARLEAARQRCGLPGSRHRFAELQEMGLIEILLAGRRRAAVAGMQTWANADLDRAE